MLLFDTCVITASSPNQAKAFSELLKKRLEYGLYPREIQFKVFPDPEKGRVGSGGSTLLVLKKLYESESKQNGETVLEFFSKRRILILHAGGESRRLPCYAPEGKLFAPVPVESSSLIPPTVLDVQLSLFLKYPWKKGEVVIGSGDVIIDFDCSRIPDDRGEICGFAKAAPLETGARHGVFGFDANRQTVQNFYQKASVSDLKKNALLEGSNECALDMGIVALSPTWVTKLLDFGALQYDKSSQNETQASQNNTGSFNRISDALENGILRFDLYLELMTACLKKVTQDVYLKRLLDVSTLSPDILKQLHSTFEKCELRGVITSSTVFLHFGSLQEFPKACKEMTRLGLRPFYGREGDEIRAQINEGQIQFNQLNVEVRLEAGRELYLENCADIQLKYPGGSNLLIGIRNWAPTFELPKNICIEQISVENGRQAGDVYRLVYASTDNFKIEKVLENLSLCEIPLNLWLEERGLLPKDLWGKLDSEQSFDLWTAKLYAANMSDEFISGYWWPPASHTWKDVFLSAKRLSIRDLYEQADVLQRENSRQQLRSRHLQKLILENQGWRNISKVDFLETFSGGKSADQNRDTLKEIYHKTDDHLLKLYRESHLRALNNSKRELENLQIQFLAMQSEHLKISVKQDQIVWGRCPVRLDIAGGWSDTPPYTLKYGGAVVNLAVDLNGQPPIQVFCRRLPEHCVKINSIDLGISETIQSFQDLDSFRDPTSAFSLPKAALHIIGLNPENFKNLSLEKVLKELGSGLEITLLCAVPKGSGLGTSSILSATILSTLHRFFGQKPGLDELYRQVLQSEQLLTTGGGWQDQIGGVVGGVKYIECKPGLRPSPIIYQLDPYLFQNPKMLEKYTLFYTGITRLAKGILQDVVEEYNSSSPAYLFTLNYVEKLAQQARDAISLRNEEQLAAILAASLQANCRIHASSTNAEIEKFLNETKKCYSGAKLLGAGGGGYVLFQSRDAEKADQLKTVLQKQFENEKARIVDFNVNSEGLMVSTS